MSIISVIDKDVVINTSATEHTHTHTIITEKSLRMSVNMYEIAQLVKYLV